ncbi:RNA 3'-terminal phosphate cyclase-like protein [Rhopilema esculentum]|uniref:RNA 3'-terminal phosphate cyclase-like protein n=1 Tax=Rhopilema esculentum TaxID=499914 RepID=UPI0031DEBB73
MPDKRKSIGTLEFEGCNFFRQRFVIATLAGKPIRVKSIRVEDDEPGLKEFEASFLRLLDQMTNGSTIEINETGTSVFYRPGLLLGGSVEHQCSCQRSIGYYMEAVLCLAPFCKKPLSLKLTGVTNDDKDPSVDIIKYVSIPILKKFIVDDDVDLKIIKRGTMPGGGGEILFHCPVRRSIRPINFTDRGKIKRIRGTAFTLKVAPAFTNRMVDSCRSILNQFVSDIYIYTDHRRGAESGHSPGFGLSLMAESTTGAMTSAEFASPPPEKGSPVTPEDAGRQAAFRLLEETYKGGCIDSSHQGLALTFMALTQMDVSRVMIGQLTQNSIHLLRHLKDFFNVVYKIDVKEGDSSDEVGNGADEKYILSCLGTGFSNLSKTSI